jgi:hypothetical protein
MPTVTTHYSVPSTKYKYRFPLPGPADTEFFKLTINPTQLAPKTGRALLRLEVRTPGDPFGIPMVLGLSNVVVAICIPVVALANPNTPAGASPPTIDPQSSTVSWKHGSIANGTNLDYQVDFTWVKVGMQKVEVVLKAEEIDRPVRMVVQAPLP